MAQLEKHLKIQIVKMYFVVCNGLPTYISQVKSYLQIAPEVVCKAGKDIKDLQQVVPLDAVQITVGDGLDV